MNQKIRQAIADVKRGKPVLVVDDYTRENEADLVIAGTCATKHNLVFAMRHGKGLMCLPCNGDRLDALDIKMMESNHNDKFETPFTVSIDATHGTTSGMSVYDRLKTIEVLLDPHATPEELSQPGHLFPLRPKTGLLKERRGHTEASIELMKLAELPEVAIIIEVMNEDGTMLRGIDLDDFSKIYDLSMVSVEEIYEARYGAE